MRFKNLVIIFSALLVSLGGCITGDRGVESHIALSDIVAEHAGSALNVRKISETRKIREAIVKFFERIDPIWQKQELIDAWRSTPILAPLLDPGRDVFRPAMKDSRWAASARLAGYGRDNPVPSTVFVDGFTRGLQTAIGRK